MRIINALVTLFLYPVSLLIWHNDLAYKKFLYNRKGRKFFLEKYLVSVYTKRLSSKGSYIGQFATFKNNPIFPHGIYGVFISGDSVIGRNCVIYQQVTIGSNTLKGNSHFGSPKIGDNVLIGAGAKVIGKVTVGNNVRIGANAVIVRDVPDNCVVVSSGRVIQKEGTLDNRYYSYGNGKWGYFKDGSFVIDESMNNK